MSEKCIRPNCKNRGGPNRRGFCAKHFEQVLKAEGRAPGHADAGPVVEHLHLLQKSGLSVRCISDQSGVSHFGISLILAGKRERVRGETARKLMSVNPRALTQAYDGARIPAIGTVRRLRALHAIGYTGTALSAMLGASYGDAVRTLLSGAQPTVRAATARRVDEIFRELQLKPVPPSRVPSRAINRAKSLGWALPLEWDENTIDDPEARPFKPILSDGEFAIQYEKWRARGYGKAKIAQLTGMSVRSVQRRAQTAAA